MFISLIFVNTFKIFHDNANYWPGDGLLLKSDSEYQISYFECICTCGNTMEIRFELWVIFKTRNFMFSSPIFSILLPRAPLILNVQSLKDIYLVT